MIISSFRFHPKLAALKNVTILPPAAPVVRIDGYIADAMYKDLVRIFCIVDQVYRNNVPTYITRYQGATTVCLALSLDKQTLYCNCQYLFKHIHRVFCAGAQKIFFLLHPFVPATAAIFRILPPLAHLVHIYGRNTHTRQNAAEDYAHAAKIAAFFAGTTLLLTTSPIRYPLGIRRIHPAVHRCRPHRRPCHRLRHP